MVTNRRLNASEVYKESVYNALFNFCYCLIIHDASIVTAHLRNSILLIAIILRVRTKQLDLDLS